MKKTATIAFLVLWAAALAFPQVARCLLIQAGVVSCAPFPSLAENRSPAPFPSLREYSMLYGLNRERERLMKPEAIICHPGPINRGVELDSYMADNPERSVILDQVYAGILVRMAALYLLLGGAEDGIAG